jgi:rhodanese-related sulfurtransferase
MERTPKGAQVNANATPPHDITPLELKERMDRDDVPVLVDVREHWERDVADLPDVGQHRVPLAELLTRHEELDHDAEIVVYCRSGARSDNAARFLRQRGFSSVMNLVGGVLAWRQDVDPSIKAY